MIKLYEPEGQLGAAREHLSRKNQDGISGLDKLRDHGIEFTHQRTPGTIEIAKNGLVTGSVSDAILYSIEPPLILPQLYQSMIHQPFLAKFVFIDTSEDNIKEICGRPSKNVYRSMYCSLLDYKASWQEKEKFMVTFLALMSTNNTFTEKHDLYSARPGLIEKSYEKFGEDFDYYGRSGEAGFKCYKGSPYDERRWEYPKFDVICKYKFVLTVENSSFRGYVDKIDHPFIVRSIPVYKGAPDIEQYAPKELFINIDDYTDYDDCLNYIESLSEERINQWIHDIDDYMNDSEKTYKLSSLYLADEFIKLANNL